MDGKGDNWDTLDDLVTQEPDREVVLGGRYRVGRKLGEGGMGSVWLAEDSTLDGREVAIKMLPAHLATNKRAIKSLKEEAKLAMALSHPNVVTLRSFEEADQGVFLIMDYVNGETLEEMLADREALPVDEVMRLFLPLAQAIDYAHTKKVVHRDIKPSNVLIDREGIPYVTDFGIAREMKDTFTRVTGSNTSGTLPYMAPEQLRGEQPSPAQDVYSLAAAAFECLTGHPPFHRGQIEYQILNVAPEWPEEIEVTSAILRVFQSLAKDPKERPTSCCAIFAATEAGVDVAAPPPAPAVAPPPAAPAPPVAAAPIPPPAPVAVAPPASARAAATQPVALAPKPLAPIPPATPAIRVCPACDAHCGGEDAFCSQCGAWVLADLGPDQALAPRNCSQCQASVEPIALYCTSCGEPLEEDP